MHFFILASLLDDRIPERGAYVLQVPKRGPVDHTSRGGNDHMEGVRWNPHDDRHSQGNHRESSAQSDELFVLLDGVLRGDRRHQEDQKYRSLQTGVEELLHSDRSAAGGG